MTTTPPVLPARGRLPGRTDHRSPAEILAIDARHRAAYCASRSSPGPGLMSTCARHFERACSRRDDPFTRTTRVVSTPPRPTEPALAVLEGALAQHRVPAARPDPPSPSSIGSAPTSASSPRSGRRPLDLFCTPMAGSSSARERYDDHTRAGHRSLFEEKFLLIFSSPVKTSVHAVSTPQVASRRPLAALTGFYEARNVGYGELGRALAASASELLRDVRPVVRDVRR